MALAPGQTLAHYTILGPIGAGAMGEVWRARDTKLDREVAIKVLPEHFADDEERLRRFEREAKTLAALNHPNVAQIYGVDQIGDTCFLVLELVPGTSLAERLKRGPLPIDDAIEVCRQIAEALDAAHEAGVVHRDLKPANVCLTPGGQAKVLDFGIAKLARDSTDSALSTEDGRVLGTPTYMAPEQARGKPVDRRADVWALGCVLYECLTGKRAFPGAGASDVLASVLRSEPDLSRLPDETPRRVRALLAECLAKDPRARLRDAGEVRRQLESARSEPVGAEPVARRSTSKVVASAVVASALAGGLAWLAGRATSKRTDPPPIRSLHLVGAGFGGGWAPAISPDGSQIAYTTFDPLIGSARLRLRPLDRDESLDVGGQIRCINPFFSPDSARLGCFTPDDLSTLSLRTGELTSLVRTVDYAEASWSTAGGIVFTGAVFDGAASPALAWIPESGGTPRAITRLGSGETRHTWPEVLPDGRTVLFTVVGARSTSIAVGSIDGGEHRILVRDAGRPKYSATGHLLYGDTKGRLMACAFDAASATIRGEPAVLLEGLYAMTDGGWGFDASREGTLVYTLAHDTAVPVRRVVLADRAGGSEKLPVETGNWQECSLSPDERSIALRKTGIPNCSLWILDRRRPLLTHLPIDGDTHNVSWTPDGKSLTFTLDRGGRQQACRIPADGSGSVEPISRDDLSYMEVIPFGDGSEYVCTVRRQGSDLDVLLLDGESGRTSPLIEGPSMAFCPVVSPDGRWLAYCSDETGRIEVYVRPFREGGSRTQVSSAGGAVPRWSRDGTELYYVEDPRLMAVGIEAKPELEVTAPSPVFPESATQEFGSVKKLEYDVTGDRGKFLLIEGDPTWEMGPLHVVLGWERMLERAR